MQTFKIGVFYRYVIPTKAGIHKQVNAVTNFQDCLHRNGKIFIENTD